MSVIVYLSFRFADTIVKIQIADARGQYKLCFYFISSFSFSTYCFFSIFSDIYDDLEHTFISTSDDYFDLIQLVVSFCLLCIYIVLKYHMQNGNELLKQI